MSTAGAGGRRLGRGLESLLGPISREHAEARVVGELRGAGAAIHSADERARPKGARRADGSIEARLLQPVSCARATVTTTHRPREAVAAVAAAGGPMFPSREGSRRPDLLTLALIENRSARSSRSMRRRGGVSEADDEFSVGRGSGGMVPQSSLSQTPSTLKLPAEVQGLCTTATQRGHARACSRSNRAMRYHLARESAASDGRWRAKHASRRRANPPGRRRHRRGDPPRSPKGARVGRPTRAASRCARKRSAPSAVTRNERARARHDQLYSKTTSPAFGADSRRAFADERAAKRPDRWGTTTRAI